MNCLAAVKLQNPDISGAEQMVEKQKLQVDLARKDFYPDFNVQYMWQRTDPTQFRAYYMLSVGVQVPIYRSRKQRPELAQAQAELAHTQSEADAQAQQVAFQVRTAFDTAEKTYHRVVEDRSGTGSFRSHAPSSNRASPLIKTTARTFRPLLTSFLDVLPPG